MAIDPTLKYVAIVVTPVNISSNAIFQGDTETYDAFIARVSGYAGSTSFGVYLLAGTYMSVIPHVLQDPTQV